MLTNLIPTLARAIFLTALGVFAGILLLLCYKGGEALSGHLFGQVGEQVFTLAFVAAAICGSVTLLRRLRLK
jgi:hypothetical protein